MSSVRTIVRDAVVAAYGAPIGTTYTDYAVSLRYLEASEITRSHTVCVVATDEQRSADSFDRERYSLTLLTILYAMDTRDPRGVLDAMIEDGIRVMGQAVRPLRESGVILAAALESLATDEATTASGPLAQAVLRWRCEHRRPALLVFA